LYVAGGVGLQQYGTYRTVALQTHLCSSTSDSFDQIWLHEEKNLSP
jgi:hypothetical protein